jgi:hypothetical protein
MKGKALKSRGESDSLGNYLTTGKNRKAEFVCGSVSNLSDFNQQAKRMHELRPDIPNYIGHHTLSLPEGDTENKDRWAEAIEIHLEQMGMQNLDYISYLHPEKHQHVHIEFCRISPDGKVWDEHNSGIRIQKSAAQIEQKMGMRKTRTLSEFQKETGKRRHSIKDAELQMMARTGTVGSRRKAAIAAKIAAERKQNGTQGRDSSADGKASRSGAGLAPHQAKPRKTLHETAVAGVNSGSPSGKIRVSSYSNRKGEVVFKINHKQVARLTADRQHIEVFSLDESAIDLAIRHAVRSGQVPLEIYGTPEFIRSAEALAKARGVPVAQRFPQSGIGQNQPLTPTPTEGAANAYRELRITDPFQTSHQRPPTRNGRVRTLSQIAVVQRGRAQVLLQGNARVHLDEHRADSDQQMRRLNDQGANMKTDVDQMQPDMNSPDFKRMEAAIEERRSQLPQPIKTTPTSTPKSASEPMPEDAPRQTSAPAMRPKF